MSVPDRFLSSGRLARRLVRNRWPILLSWLGLFVVLVPAAARLRTQMEAATFLRDSESASVEEDLRSEFGSSMAQSLVLVARGFPAGPGFSASLGQVVDSIHSIPGVTGSLSFLDGGDSLLIGSEPGSAVILVGVDPGPDSPDSLVARLRGALGAEGVGPTFRWTGLPALSLDMRHASTAHARQAEIRSLPLTLTLLLLAFGSIVAAMLPLVFGVLSIIAALGGALLVSFWWTPAILLESVVSILGLALGIDYALLFVTRFREGLEGGMEKKEAAASASSRAGKTILLSGTTVAVGFAALLIVPIEEIRSVALGGLLTVMAAVLLSTTLLPVALSWIGEGVNRGRPWSTLRRRLVGAAPSKETGQTSDPSPGSTWIRWGRFVTKYPLAVLVVAAVPLLLLSLPALRLSTLTPQQDWFPASTESYRAIQDLKEIDRVRLTNLLTIVVELPPAATDQGWEGIKRLTQTLAQNPMVSQVRSLPALARKYPVPESVFLMMVPDSVRREFSTGDGRLARLDIIPTEAASVGDLAGLVRQVRGMDTPAVTGLEGSSLRVGGVPAFQVDYEEAVSRVFPLVFLLVLSGVFIALAIGFKSLLVPLKATVLNLLSVGAAFGALVLVFQDGLGLSLFGLTEPLDGVFPAVPILVFCIVFGLSMDYEVFLVGRVAEARQVQKGISEAEAIVEGLAGTGRLITTAAAIMVAIFGAFSLGPTLPTKLLGFALMVAVFVDATLVRLAIGPALLQLAGRWNWWPGERGKAPLAEAMVDKNTC